MAAGRNVPKGLGAVGDRVNLIERINQMRRRHTS
jgi:hypothetical protein